MTSGYLVLYGGLNSGYRHPLVVVDISLWFLKSVRDSWYPVVVKLLTTSNTIVSFVYASQRRGLNREIGICQSNSC